MYGLVSMFFNIYIILIIVRSLSTWLGPSIQYQQWFKLLSAVTDPVLVPIRNTMNQFTGNLGIDFSPLVAIVLLNILQKIVLDLLRY